MSQQFHAYIVTWTDFFARWARYAEGKSERDFFPLDSENTFHDWMRVTAEPWHWRHGYAHDGDLMYWVQDLFISARSLTPPEADWESTLKQLFSTDRHIDPAPVRSLSDLEVVHAIYGPDTVLDLATRLRAIDWDVIRSLAPEGTISGLDAGIVCGAFREWSALFSTAGGRHAGIVMVLA